MAIDSLPNKFLDETINKREGQQTWEEFATEMSEKDILPFDWQKHMPEHFKKSSIFSLEKIFRLCSLFQLFIRRRTTTRHCKHHQTGEI